MAAPVVKAVSSSSFDGSYNVGDVITVAVIFDDAVTVTGTPLLVLETGSTDRVAFYASGSGTNTLTFNYTVNAGDFTFDLDYTSTAALEFNGGTIRNAGSEDAVLTLPAPGTVDSLGGNKDIAVDGVAADVTSVGVPANGTYGAGQNLDVVVNFNEAVLVDTSGGTPRLAITLDSGGTVYAGYLSGSGSTALTFRLVVQSGQVDGTGIALGSSIDANGGTLRDSAGNAANPALNGVPTTTGVLVDAAAPAVTTVSVPENGLYAAGDTLEFTVNFNEVVTVTGTPRIAVILDAGGPAFASYVSGSGTGALVFRMTATAEQADGSGIAIGGSIDLNGGSITDANGNSADATLNGIASTSGVLVHNDPPMLTGLTASVAFLENEVNAAPRLLFPDVTFRDVEGNFDGGTLVISGLLAEDTVSIRDQGLGAGKIGYDAGTGVVTFGGLAIGTASAGSGITLTVTFNASATSQSIEALIENLTYANSSHTPTASRDVEIRIVDEAGAAAMHASSFAPAASNPFAGIDVGYWSTPAFADIDGDGDLDLAVGALDGTLNYYRNIGTSTSPNYLAVTGVENPLVAVGVGVDSTPAFADIDADGDLDLVVGEFGGTLKYYRNDGKVTAPSYVEVTDATNPFAGIAGGPRSAPAFADLDGDGDLDLIAGAFGGTLNYYRNTGTATVPHYVAVTDATNPLAGIDIGSFSAPIFADLDGDGDHDLIVGENYGFLRYYRNVGTATAPSFLPVTDATDPFAFIRLGGGNSTPAFADLDGDGDLDLLSGEYTGTLLHYRNTTPRHAEPVFVPVNGAADPFAGLLTGMNFSGAAPAFADLDADGDDDMILGEVLGELFYFRNVGTAATPNYVAAGPIAFLDAGFLSKPAFADVDGDGDADLVVGNADGVLTFYRNTGTAALPGFVAVTGASDPFSGIDHGRNSAPAFADLDGDGDLDLVVGNTSDDSVAWIHTLHYYRNDGSASDPAYTEVTGPTNPFDGLEHVQSPAFVDLDSDGDSDMAWSANGAVGYYRNIGSATAPKFQAVDVAANPFAGIPGEPSFADLDGDGDADLIAVGPQSQLVFYRNTGAGFVLTVNVTAQNDAPSAVLLTDVHAPIAENASTKVPIKIADIGIADVDGGNNVLSLAGADAGLFQIIGGDLWLRAGAKLDFENNPRLDVTVNVNDPAVGGAVDAFRSLSLTVLDRVEVLNGNNNPNTLIGGNWTEVINGLGGNDRISGNGGNDRIRGGLGADLLTGGQGRDLFVYGSIAESTPGLAGYFDNGYYSPLSGRGLRDVITDFTSGQDRIDFSAIDANTKVAGNQAFAWRGTGNFTGVAGQLIERRYDPIGTTDDKTVIYGDVNGDRLVDFQVELTGLKALVPGDFVL